MPSEAFKLLLQALKFSEEGLAGGSRKRKKPTDVGATAAGEEKGNGSEKTGGNDGGVGVVEGAQQQAGPKQAKLTAFFKKAD